MTSASRGRRNSSSSSSTSGVIGSVGVERHRQQRQPGVSCGADAATASCSRRARCGAESAGCASDRLAEQLADHEVRGWRRCTARRPTPAAASRRRCGAPPASAASCRCPARPRPRPRCRGLGLPAVGRLDQPADLVVAADQRQILAAAPRARDRRPQRTPRTGSRLPLTRNGSSAGSLELDRRCRQHRRGGAGSGPARAGHQPGGEVDGVAHHGVACGGMRADVSGEDGPRLTPIRTGIGGRLGLTIERRVSSIRSSSSPSACGVPAARMILPPSRSMSVPRKVTPCASAALWAVEISDVEAIGDRRRRRRASIMASMSSKWTKATVTGRCTGSSPPASTWPRIAVGT